MHENYNHIVIVASRRVLEEMAHGVIERMGKGDEERRRAEISVFLAVFSHIFE